MEMSILLIALMLSFGCARCETPKPLFVEEDGRTVLSEYHGVIFENETEVRFTPAIHVRLVDPKGDNEAQSNGGNVKQPSHLCSVRLYHPNEAVIPFEADLATGRIRIVLRDNSTVSYDVHPLYKFQMVAVDCQERHSAPVHVQVRVEPQIRPRFAQDTYTVSVADDTLPGTVIGQFRASFNGKYDAATDASAICEYQLEHSSELSSIPFAADQSGNIIVSQRLANEQRTLQLAMRAVTCEQRDLNGSLVHRRVWSRPASIRIRILPRCTPILSGVPHRVSGVAGRQMTPFANASLVFCTPRDPSQCFAEACARDYSLRLRLLYERESQSYSASECDAVANANNFPRVATCAPAKSQTALALLDDETEFDGSRFTEVSQSETQAAFNMAQSSPFFITWWLQRSAPAMALKPTSKEQIVCASDGESDKRHHFSVFVHDCRLIASFHTEANASHPRTGKNDGMGTVQWRFNVPETCDARWHHFALAVDDSSVRLFVDRTPVMGSRIETLHDGASRHVKARKLTIGACMHAAAGRYVQFFSGKLASVGLVRASAEQTLDQSLGCLASCPPPTPVAILDTAKVESTADRVEQLVSALRTVRLMPRTRGDHVVELSLTHTRDDLIGECIVDESTAATRLVVAVEESVPTPEASVAVSTTQAEGLTKMPQRAVEVRTVQQTRSVQEPARPHTVHRLQMNEGGMWFVPIAIVMLGTVVCVALFVSARTRRGDITRTQPPNTTCVDLDSLEIHLDNRLNDSRTTEQTEECDESESASMIRRNSQPSQGLLHALGSMARRVMTRVRQSRSFDVAEGELEWDATGSQLHIVDNPFALDGEGEDESVETVRSRIRLVNENLAFGNSLLSNSLLRDAESRPESPTFLVSDKLLNMNASLAVSEKHLNVNEVFDSIDSTSESEDEPSTKSLSKALSAMPSATVAKPSVTESRSCYDRFDGAAAARAATRLVSSRSTSSFCAKSTMLLRNVADSARMSRLKSREQRFLDTSSSSSDDEADVNTGTSTNAGASDRVSSSGYHYDTSDGSFSKVRVGSQPNFTE